MDRPDCYECKHRSFLPGSSHSRCSHPSTKTVGDPLLEVLGIFASVGRVAPILADTGLHVKGHITGIARGWFNWPFNFDPVWLLECDGFEARKEE